MRVQKEQSTGRYYFDAVIPSDMPAGDHRISVQDESGDVQAWTPVTVGGSAPSQAVDKSKLTAAVDAAGELAEKDYTADSWAVFSKALADAKAVAGKQRLAGRGGCRRESAGGRAGRFEEGRGLRFEAGQRWQRFSQAVR